MTKPRPKGKRLQQDELELLFEQASKQQDDGKLTSAFRLFLKAAKAGDVGAQLNLGNLYSDGTGVKRNRAKALEWYRRAYRQSYGPAASNLGVIYRDERKLNRALLWFERAVKLKDADANLEIAKIYLHQGDRPRAARYLKRTCKARVGDVTEASREEAQRLLRELNN